MSRPPAAAIVAMVALFAALCATIPFTPLMSVDDITVEGATNLPEDEVRELTGISTGTALGKVDARGAALNVASNPWVDSATVSRNWPNGIQVTVTEHEPVAWVDIDGQPHLIDREGKDFIVAPPPLGAVEIRADGDFEQAVQVASSISDTARPRVRALETEGKYNYKLVLDDDRVVHWGASVDNANKALALETVLQMEGGEFNISNPELVTSR